MQRSDFLFGVGAAVITASAAPSGLAGGPLDHLANLERSTGGRLGLYAWDSATRRVLSHRASERFPMCSTFKILLVADVLSRVDRGEERLDRRITYGKADLQSYAPVAQQHVREGFMTAEALCAAAIGYSDNTAANLLFASVGGPARCTAYVRTLGDAVTSLNRDEPSLNSGLPGDPRDTTTPSAIAHDARSILLGDILSVRSRDLLLQWFLGSHTGEDLIRAAVPGGWHVGDKSGTGGQINAVGDYDTRNDVAIVWPPDGKPIVIAAYLTQSKLKATQRDAAIAEVGRIVSSAFRP
jgi:beta-lactamase class A